LLSENNAFIKEYSDSIMTDEKKIAAATAAGCHVIGSRSSWLRLYTIYKDFLTHVPEDVQTRMIQNPNLKMSDAEADIDVETKKNTTGTTPNTSTKTPTPPQSSTKPKTKSKPKPTSS